MSDVLLTEQLGRVLVMTINRPEARNAIDHEVATALVATVAELDADPGISASVLTGAGSSFCAGMDLKAFAVKGVPRDLIRFYQTGSSKPLVAAVNGYAFGGGLELVLTCDLVVAERNAKFGAPEVKVGLVAGGGALLRLSRRLPYNVAMEMALTGRSMTAQEAQGYGFLNRVTDPADTVTEAVALAESIGKNAPLATSTSKKLLQDSWSMSDEAFWEYQHGLTKVVLKSDDAKEGARAFAEKRVPQWTGR